MGKAFSARRAGALLAPALAAFGLTLAAGLAVAQPTPTTSEITVVAPRSVIVVGATSNGVPIEKMWIAHNVGYSDLDLTQPANVLELDKRIKQAAVKGCEELDRAYPDSVYPSFDSAQNCVKIAVNKAMGEVDAAVAAAKK